MLSIASYLIAITTVCAYLIGGLPFGYWFVRLSAGKDIRTMGSGNIGATNVQRTLGTKAGIVVLLLDILKGFFAVWLAAALTQANPVSMALSSVSVMLGHCYPIFLGFKGGKAVACFVGAFLYLEPKALAMTLAIFVVIVWLRGYISLGSLLGALVFPFIVWLTNNPPAPILAASVAGAALIIYRHKGNISRLRRGTENVFSLKGKKV